MTQPTEANNPMIANIRSARAAGVPLLAIVTQDQPATIAMIEANITDGGARVTWDCITGMRALNDKGKTALQTIKEAADATRPVMLLKACAQLPPGSIVYMHNAHAFVSAPDAAQGVQNLREVYKENKRTLVMLGPSFGDMRPELQADVVVLEEALPSDAQLATLITDLHGAASKTVDPTKLSHMVDAVRGLPALFTAEQVVAMSFRKTGLDMDALWERKKAAINATQGLTITRGTTRYADLAGMDSIQTFLTRYQKGPRPFRLVLFWDEIEKMMAGAGGDAQDSSGVSSDYLGVCLKTMENLRWAGVVLLGVPGSGKTALAEATSGEFGVPKIEMDFGAMKGKYVGDSEGAIRQAFRVVESIGGADVLVVATCNRMKSLPAEFRRRFWLGNWYFDVPTLDEQKPIKAIYERKFGVAGEWPDTTAWTGAEIRNCAELATRLGCTLVEAGEYIVPIAKADPESIEAVRDVADGRFLSVANAGTWSRASLQPVNMNKNAGKRQIGA